MSDQEEDLVRAFAKGGVIVAYMRLFSHFLYQTWNTVPVCIIYSIIYIIYGYMAAPSDLWEQESECRHHQWGLPAVLQTEPHEVGGIWSYILYIYIYTIFCFEASLRRERRLSTELWCWAVKQQVVWRDPFIFYITSTQGKSCLICQLLYDIFPTELKSTVEEMYRSRSNLS